MPVDRLLPTLGGRASRSDLAASLRRVLTDAARPRPSITRIQPARERVRRAAPELELLARRLASADPVDPRGLALARDLVSDGAGPLYWRGSPQDLGARVREALAALEGDSTTAPR